MKGYKKFLPLILAVLLVGTLAISVKTRMDTDNSYNTAVSNARSMESKRIYVDAIEYYRQALELRPSPELYYEAGQAVAKGGGLQDIFGWYEEMQDAYPEEPLSYYYGIEQMARLKGYERLFEVYSTFRLYELDSPEVEALVDPYRYVFKLNGRYMDVRSFNPVTLVAAARYEEGWGALSTVNGRVLDYEYQEIGPGTEFIACVDADGYACYKDFKGDERRNGDFILEKDPEFGQTLRFGAYRGAAIWAWNGKVWNAYNIETFDRVAGGYADVHSFTRGVGAVSNGSKWALMAENGTLLTDFKFDDVLASDQDQIAAAPAIFVRVGDTYKLVDLQGNDLGTDTYTQVKPFIDGSYAAVERNGKWCYVDGTGAVALETDYEEIGPFCSGMAAVKQNGLWGYIGLDTELKIPCQFEAAGPMTSDGRAFVREPEKLWTLLQLYYFE